MSFLNRKEGINSYIPKKRGSAIVIFDRAGRALRELQAKFQGHHEG